MKSVILAIYWAFLDQFNAETEEQQILIVTAENFLVVFSNIVRNDSTFVSVTEWHTHDSNSIFK